MKRARKLGLGPHGSIEVLMGMATLVAPVALSSGTPGTILLLGLGAILIGIGLTLTASSGSASGGSAFAWHRELDALIAVAAALAALLLALAGDRATALYLVLLVTAQTSLNGATRYVAAH